MLFNNDECGDSLSLMTEKEISPTAENETSDIIRVLFFMFEIFYREITIF